MYLSLLEILVLTIGQLVVGTFYMLCSMLHNSLGSELVVDYVVIYVAIVYVVTSTAVACG